MVTPVDVTEEIENDVLYQEIDTSIPTHLRVQIYHILQNLGVTQYERRLGSGAQGAVIQLDGGKKFPGKKIALKLLPDREWYNSIHPYSPHGEVIALDLPKRKHLARAFGLLIADEEKVHFVEKIDYRIDTKYRVIGVFSRAIKGKTLFEHQPMSLEDARGYGKAIAVALHALHQKGYIHKDLKGNNVLIKERKEGKPPYRVKIIDFGLSAKNTERGFFDWECFQNLMYQMLRYSDRSNPQYQKLLCDLFGRINGEAVVNHPFFNPDAQPENSAII